MKTQEFIKDLTLSQIEEYFCSLSESQQAEIFTDAIVEGCNNPDDEYFSSDELEIFLEGKNPIEIFELGQQAGSGWGKYFYIGIYGITFFDDAQTYMLGFIDDMEDYIKDNYETELSEYFDFEEEKEKEEEEEE